MSFIQRELQRLGRALRNAPDGGDYAEIYAAQQALAWVLEPAVVQRPSLLLTSSEVGEADCWADIRLETLSETDRLESTRRRERPREGR
jgi:hypothetical protein